MTTPGTNVVLHEQDIAIVTEFATKLGVSFSAALRVIVRDWDARRTSLHADARDPKVMPCNRQGEM